MCSVERSRFFSDIRETRNDKSCFHYLCPQATTAGFRLQIILMTTLTWQRRGLNPGPPGDHFPLYHLSYINLSIQIMYRNLVRIRRPFKLPTIFQLACFQNSNTLLARKLDPSAGVINDQNVVISVPVCGCIHTHTHS